MNEGNREFAWLWVWLALVLSVAVGTGVTILLWGGTRAEHRDAFDTGWKSAAAVLAILAAVVTVERLRLGQREHRRQLVADRAKQDTDRATQITDLSAKASEQLGSDKAAVRIGGLTDLERLAQSHPDLRQTVVDRICAYLRAPYPYEKEAAADRLELDVRRTAQQVLERHLRWPKGLETPPVTYWENTKLDLRDAILVEFDLSGCRFTSGDFRDATFHHRSLFDDMVVSEKALFSGATFGGDRYESVSFKRASFGGQANFRHVAFLGYTWFGDASFAGGCSFTDAVFSEQAVFSGASFAGDTLLSVVSFRGSATFARATFADFTSFKRTNFSKPAEFGETSFQDYVNFAEATVADATAKHELPSGWVVEPEPDRPGGRISRSANHAASPGPRPGPSSAAR